VDERPSDLVDLGGGSLVERDVLNIVEAVYAYDPNLRVKFLERAASLADAPYAITEICNDGVERLVFYVWSLDQRVLERLYMADNSYHGILDRIDRNNSAVKNQMNRRFQEKLGQAGDITAHVLKSPKGRYTVRDGDKLIKFDDDNKPSWTVEDRS
jgi:hypothetical protein